ncbi:putative tripartite motif containing 13-like [Apostichopus japonicus]|uniref:Putative tripartite motif containing 13-like n=2 Tax=Stichopus japonicus TaxID=307972 RepID=A0A2G8KGQ6_STIJA|nr:putative tripartite motif containing 13-like [Apostichopus japonicus]
MLTDHQPHTLKLDDIETKKLTLDKLAALTEDPMCDVHVNENAKLCCSTCGNLPVCVICTYSKHKGHDLHDVTELAKNERKLLEPKLAELNKHKVKLYDLPKKVKDTTIKLKESVVNVTESVKKQHKEQAHKIKDKLAEVTNVRERGILSIENLRKVEDNQTSSNFEKELNQLREKYDNIRKTTKWKYDDKCKGFKEYCNRIEEQLSRKVESLDLNLKNLTTKKELLAKRNEDELKEISESCEQIINRYENFTITSSSVLSSNDDWTDVQCIPDIRAACEPLIEEMKKEFPDFTSLYVFPISDITKVTFDDVTETKHEEPVIDALGIKGKRRWINGIASSGEGHFVITGIESEGYTHITVINKKGEVVRKDQIQNQRSRSFALRYCCSLSNRTVATACLRDEVSIYDVHSGVLSKRNISDVISDWPHDRFVSCVAFDPLNSHIIVGTGSRYMYVFDDQLRYSHTITLPDVIKYSYDITVHRGSLLVCDSIGKRVYAVTMKGNLIYELMKAFLDVGDWIPTSVCTDKNDLIYMLWSTYFSGKQRCILVQYSQNDRRLLTKREVDGEASCITILEVDGTDKLLIATNESIKLYTCGIYPTSVIPCLKIKQSRTRAILR